MFGSFILSDSAGNQTEFGRMSCIGTAVTDGAENGRMDWYLIVSGTLTGKLRLNSAGLCPYTTDGISLGTASLMWSDLFVASGAVLNWNNGNVTLTHDNTNSKLTLSGDFEFATGKRLILPNSQTTVGAAGGASALPALPTGYIPFKVGSTEYVLPYYAKT